MFKIPSYSDIEKKEKELNQKQVSSSLFTKRKEIYLDTTYDKYTSKTATTTISSNRGTHEMVQKESFKKNKSDTIETSLDEDDELLLKIDLNNIKPNVSSLKQPETVFKAPEVPKFEVKKPIVTTNNQTYTQSSLLVNSKQKGNPILKLIRNVQWTFSDSLTPDYQMSRTSCALYLSMKYHLLNNEYIHDRLRELGRAYELRVLLVLVDIKEMRHCLKELEKICILANLTLILCWSYDEASRYLETYKAYEYKNADLIMEKGSTTNTYHNQAKNATASNSSNESLNFINNFTEFMCAIKSINKTDASTLRQTFGSIKELSKSCKSELSVCPGLGPLKVKRLYEIFRMPFLLKEDPQL